MARAQWLATTAAVSVAATAGVVAMATASVAAAVAARVGSGLGLGSPGGGEEWRTRGLKLCPSRVFIMFRPEKGRR